MDKKDNQDSKFLVLCLGALGVVFGDIGTSPLYAIKEIFAINNNILTLTILICWAFFHLSFGP